MKASCSDSFFTFFCLTILFILFLSDRTLAQDTSGDRPEPGTIQVPNQADEKEGRDEPATEELSPEEIKREAAAREKYGFVRLWNFAHEFSADGIAIFLSKPSSRPAPPDQRLWLGRGSRSGELRDYAEFEPGNYQVFIQRDPSRQGAMVKLPDDFDPDSDNLLPSSQALRVRPGTYQTVVVYEDGNGLAARILEDSLTKPTKLRLFNYTRKFQPAISVVANEQRVPLIENLGDEYETAIPNSARIVTLEIAYPSKYEGNTSRFHVECDFAGVRSCSLVVFYDRYGRLTARAIPDAPK